MTNKLPIVGRRYRFKNTPSSTFKIRFIDLGVELDNGYTTSLTRKSVEDFNDIEELPEDKAETKPELSPEVKEAMEELRESLFKVDLGSIFISDQDRNKIYKEIARATKKLLNALDKQFANNKIQAEEVVDNKIEAEEVVDNKIEAENGSFKHLDNAEELSQECNEGERKRRGRSDFF